MTFSIVSLLVAGILAFILSVELVNSSLISSEYLNFGRLLPLHLDWTLYGWLSFPLIGLIFSIKGDCRPKSTFIKFALCFWLLTLVLSSLYLVLGHSSGKLFLEFSDLSRHLFALNLLILSASFIFESVYIYEENKIKKYILNTFAAVVPVVWYFASSASIYPPINPSSGGPTGVSLMGSTLVILPVFILLAEKLNKGLSYNDTKYYWFFLLVHFLVFVFICDHGSISNNNFAQIISIASLIVWPLLLTNLFFKQHSNDYQKRWKTSMFIWFTILSISALVVFLPDILDHAKFGSILVAHTHLAMAGFLSSFSFLVLDCYINHDLILDCFSKSFFKQWHGIHIVHILCLIFLGLTEVGGFYYSSHSIIQALKYTRVILSLLFVLLIVKAFRGLICYQQKTL